MATILTKKSDTASAVPLAADLTNAAGGAELAVNATDKRLFSKTSGGSVVELGTNPSSLTMPNGTANGVLYLNGSKVVTSGSALTFDGTSLGVGIATPTFADGKGIHINNAVGSARLHLTSQTSGSASTDGSEFTVAGSDLYIINNESAATVFYNAGSEQMRLTSTGLGIGTSSPGVKLDVQGSVPFARVKDNSTGYLGFRAENNSGNFYFGIDSSAGAFYGSAYARVLYSDGAYPMVFYTNAAERMRIDSSGNLGLGVTPSAWSTGKAMQFNSVEASVWGAGTQIDVASNAYFNGGWKYAATRAGASIYEQSLGTHAWSVAGSGTAGNAISFTQAATLTADGDFLVGTTSSTGLSSNSKIVAGGKFRTVAGSVSAANGTATTLFTASGELGAYLVTVNVNADSVVYAATYVVNTQGGSSAVATQIYKGSLISISVSGLSVQATQSSGATQTIQYSAVRIF